MILNKQLNFWLLVFLSALLYFNLSFNTDRTHFASLMVQVSLLFILLMGIYFLLKNKDIQDSDLSNIRYAGIALRLIGLFAIPYLSDDYFRFLWDGHLSSIGMNPYLSRPSDVISEFTGNTHVNNLFDGMNSPEYFTVYPPLNQYIFAFCSIIFPESLTFQVMTMKIIILLGEIATIFYLPKLLLKIGLPEKLSLFYILNPLVIIESVGNLHFEALTVSFLVMSFYFLICEKNLISSILFGLAMGIKLIPLFLLPFVLKYLGWKKGLGYSALSMVVFVLFFLPYLSPELINHVSSSINLYFQSFEFNASVYYLMRYVGYLVKGYNIIQFAGPFLAIIFISIVIYLFVKQESGDRNSMFRTIFWVMLTFYMLSTTVHPWYLINVLFLSLLVGYRHSVSVWALFAFLSYYTYSTPEYIENLWLTFIEYSIFIIVFTFEIRNKTSISQGI